MSTLTLVRDAEDKQRYVLDGYGELRFGGMFTSGATAIASDGTTWALKARTFSSKASAGDVAGAEVATFEPSAALKRGGTLHAAGTAYALRPASNWKTRYALARGEAEIATIETAGWSGREVAIELDESAAVEATTLLMACWLVRKFGEDTSTTVIVAGS